MRNIRDNVLTNCITIGIIISIVYCFQITIERKVSMEGIKTIYSISRRT